MKKILFDSNGVLQGIWQGDVDDYSAPVAVLVDDSFTMNDAMLWQSDGVTAWLDATAALDRAKTARKARIKEEAARLIEALDWKLARARERETAAWATLSEVDAVLAEREAIRRSSSAAEVAVDAMTDVSSVQSFVWSVDVLVPVPRRLTQTQFAGRFTDTELQGILAAAQANPALGAWWEKFKLAKDINLDDLATQAGVQALEFAGLIAAGRAAAILA